MILRKEVEIELDVKEREDYLSENERKRAFCATPAQKETASEEDSVAHGRGMCRGFSGPGAQRSLSDWSIAYCGLTVCLCSPKLSNPNSEMMVFGSEAFLEVIRPQGWSPCTRDQCPLKGPQRASFTVVPCDLAVKTAISEEAESPPHTKPAAPDLGP